MKIDFKKTLGSYQARHGEFEIITVPTMQYLMVDGHGDPNTSKQFSDAIETLYPVAYKLKFMSKNTLGKDYVVPPLEGLWWADDMDTFTTRRNKSDWNWTLLLMTPEWITQEMFEAAKDAAAMKNPPLIAKLRFERLDEGLCVQTLHYGSYDDEAPVLEALHGGFIPTNGLIMVKKHHEIYFSDFRKVAPDKLRTILRQPVTKSR